VTDPGFGAFLLVFAVIGGLELGDRTNFALIGLAARQPPWPTWAGAAGAFLVTSALAVVIGTAIESVLAGEILYLRLAAGVVLIAYAAYLALVPEAERPRPSSRSAAGAAFALIFGLELGDTTMIFTINFVFTIPSPLLVFAAAALALACVAGSASFIGSRLGARVEPRLLNRVVVVLLAIAGVVTIVYALFPGSFPNLT
jgi:putative Ca2+/H+ antiporter (TMEM165/GDT1 family)